MVYNTLELFGYFDSEYTKIVDSFKQYNKHSDSTKCEEYLRN
jgi:hypothetical protein